MKLINGRWVDKNNNSWSKLKETEESAQKKSDSLVNCYDCEDCHNCKDCIKCLDCSNCRDCSNCDDCSNCKDCSNCNDCKYCKDCSNCNYCKDCIKCLDCSNCNYCKDCIKCLDCSNCNYCKDCKDCKDCSNCNYCNYCSNCNYCNYCSNCNCCKDCKDCSNFEQNPDRFVKNRIGSRRGTTTVYWIDENTHVVCGCFRGSLEQFKKRVEEVHGSNGYGKEYKDFIMKVEFLIKPRKRINYIKEKLRKINNR